MKKSILFLILSSVLYFSHAQIVITEIMYNPPESGTDTTEFIELFNASNNAVNLSGYHFTEGIVMTFGNRILGDGEYLVIAKNSTAHQTLYGKPAIEWTDGNLSNSGEDLILVNATGEEVDIVDFDVEGEWPVEPDGLGFSLELCDPFRDNNDPGNWFPSITDAQTEINGIPVFASPGMENEVPCEDLVDHTIDVLALQFDPKYLTINLDETVQWINVSGGYHNINGSQAAYPANPEGFYSGGPSNDNWVFKHTFTIPGMYKYRCDQHVAFGMTGTIEVLPEEAGKLLISEIMYNDPGVNDSLEFIEIYNYGTKTANLLNYRLTSKKIDYMLPDTSLSPGEYFVLCRKPEAFVRYFGFDAISWGDSLLNNSADKIQFIDVNGNVVDEVDYDDSDPWPGLADGFGHSMNLCRPDLDNAFGENWQECPFSAGTFVDGFEIFALPGQVSYCQYTVGEITEMNDDGEILYDDLGVEIRGTVHGVNLRPGALQLTLIDEFNEGIALFSSSSDFGYEAHEGDKIIAIGRTGQYNGLSQIYLDTVLFFGQQLPLSTPEIVTFLGEETESQLITLENVKIVDPTNWGTGTSGFNVEVTNGTDIFAIRIDNDVDLFTMNYPTGRFNVTGIGGQFDNTPPYLEGYQLLPRYVEDIDPFVPYQVPSYPIGQITGVDENGTADSLGVTCYTEGIVYGINFDGNGLNFTLIDEKNDGINIYSPGNSTGYTVQEGDHIRIKGTISQYNGLTQLEPTEIDVISSGNPLFEALDVLALNESTESQLVKIAFLQLVDEPQWKGNGSSFNVTVTNGTDEFVLRIDNDCELSEMEAPQGLFHATGIGGQYDSSEPFTSGYQLFPRYADDIDVAENTESKQAVDRVEVFPNPFRNTFRYYSENPVNSILLYDSYGKLIRIIPADGIGIIDLKDLGPGMFTLGFITADGLSLKKIIKIE